MRPVSSFGESSPKQNRAACGGTPGAMRLDRSTWREVEAYLARSDGIIIPAGSTEQHGPVGLIGTDAICAEKIGEEAGDLAGALVAPTLAYSPAPFNLCFPGSVSIPADLFADVARSIVESLRSQGFRRFYFLNGHGANVEPLVAVEREFEDARLRIRSWWDFPSVASLRESLYGDHEGMHATPSEIAITQAFDRRVVSAEADEPPEVLSPAFIRAHAGDRHGPPEEHRARYPDGRVGSHSALARPEHGRELAAAAVSAVAEDYWRFVKS